MRFTIAVAISTLALGTAFAAVPAFAQNAGPANGNSQQNPACAHFQTSCSDTPYPMAQPGAGSQRTGRAENQSGAFDQSSGQNGTTQSGRAVNNGSAGNRPRNTAENGQRTRAAETNRLARTPENPYAFSGEDRYAQGSNGEGRYGEGYYNYAGAGGFGPMTGAPDQGAIGWCEAHFRSFDPATGTYLGFDGARHACP